MNKNTLERFIAKYNLAGAAESVFLITEGGELSTRFISSDRAVLGIIKTKEFVFDEGKYAVYETARLSGLLGVLGDDIRVKVNKDGKEAKSLLLSDGKAKVTFVLADPAVIPATPTAKQLPTFDITVKLDEEFISRFVKAKNGLPDVETFTVLSDDKKARVVLGHSRLNTNRVEFEVQSDTTKEIDSVNFNAQYMKDILLANKEATEGKLEVSTKGLAHVTFKVEGFEVDYYLVAVQKV